MNLRYLSSFFHQQISVASVCVYFIMIPWMMMTLQSWEFLRRKYFVNCSLDILMPYCEFVILIIFSWANFSTLRCFVSRKYVTQYNKRYILPTFEKIYIFALSNRRFNKLSNDTKFIRIEVMLLKIQVLQSVNFLFIFYTLSRINLADK